MPFLSDSDREALLDLLDKHSQAHVCRQLNIQAGQLLGYLAPNHEFRQATYDRLLQSIATFSAPPPAKVNGLSDSERAHLQSLIDTYGQTRVARQLGFQASQLHAFCRPEHSMQPRTLTRYREAIERFDPNARMPRKGRPSKLSREIRMQSAQVIEMTYLQLWEHSSSSHPYHQYRRAMDRLTPLGTLPFVEWFALVSNGFNLSPDPNETLPARQSKALDDLRYNRPSGNPPLPDSHLPPHIADKQSEVAFSAQGDCNIQDYFYLLEPTNQPESR